MSGVAAFIIAAAMSQAWRRGSWYRTLPVAAVAALFLLPPPSGTARAAIGSGGASGDATRQRIDVVVGLRWRDQAELSQLLRDLSNPDSPRYGRYLTAAEFNERFGPTEATIEATRLVLRDHGLGVVDVSASGLFLSASGWVTDVSATRDALLSALRDLMQKVRLYFYLQIPAAAGSASGAAGDDAVTLRPPIQTSPLIARAGEPAFTPASIAGAYGFDILYDRGIDGRGTRDTTIAIATAYGFEREDLRAFWAESGIRRSDADVELTWVGGASEATHIETTVDVQWVSSLAPGAPVIVYATPEPSTHGFLKVYDQIVSENRAAVLVTSWGACENVLSLTYLEQAHIIFQRAAAQGMTVIAASGDRGADDCESGGLSVDFPASDPNVLAVGGTTLRNDGFSAREDAWGGSGGGISAVWPAPPWQLHPSRNRVLADVAFQADPRPGFSSRFEGRALVVGGTSLAAPAWAALVALANDVRGGGGVAPLGVAAPALCEAARAPAPPEPPFRDIWSGDNGGFPAAPGWDFPTGWGTPRAAALVDALAEAYPGPLSSAHAARGIVLTRSGADVGRLRAQLLQECGRSALRLQARGMAPGDYVVAFNGAPVASFTVGNTGRSTVTFPGLDPRGVAIGVMRDGAGIVFGGYFPAQAETSTRIAVALDGTGTFAAATGVALYQRRHGQERFTVRVRNVSPGVYDLRLGNVMLAPITVGAGKTGARVTFNVLGTSTGYQPTSALCEGISVLRDGVPVLYAGRNARSLGLCP